MGTCFVYITVIVGWPVGLSKEVCLHAGADWRKLVCHSEGGERSVTMTVGSIALGTGSSNTGVAAIVSSVACRHV